MLGVISVYPDKMPSASITCAFSDLAGIFSEPNECYVKVVVGCVMFLIFILV